jgi:hypothetical protein
MEIQGFNDYLIYPDGKVFSKKRNKYLKPFDKGRGYKYVKLPDNKCHSIHRLVAIHYIPNPDNKPEVDHKNRTKDDNRVENLRWVTREENMLNLGHRKNNKTRFKWISNDNTRGCYIYNHRMMGKTIFKRSKNLSILLCYSFFYQLKHRF